MRIGEEKYEIMDYMEQWGSPMKLINVVSLFILGSEIWYVFDVANCIIEKYIINIGCVECESEQLSENPSTPYESIY